MISPIKARNLHRDLGYFYIGLIISFAFSGILMNHRDYWHPEKYTVQTKTISVNIPKETEITEKYADELGKKLGIGRIQVSNATSLVINCLFDLSLLTITTNCYIC